MFVALKIAWRFLINSKFQTLIIILGIGIGISVQMFVGLLSTGLETSLLNKVVGNSTHITIYPKNNIIENYQQKREKIKKFDSKIISVASVVEYNTSEASTLAAFFPAIKSFRLMPVEVIKNG